MNRQNLRIMKNRLLKKSNNFKETLYNRVLASNIDSLNKIINFINTDKSLLNKLKKELMPPTIEKICNTKLITFGTDIYSALYWSMSLVNIFKAEIEAYVLMKGQYEKYLFSGKYEQAYEVIKNIEESICVSLWSIKQTFLLKEFIGGLQSNKETLEEYSKKARHNIIIQIIISFYSNQAEQNVSYINYQENIKNYLEKFDKDKNKVLHYFDYKLNLDSEADTANLIIPMQLDSEISIIDTYETLIDILQMLSYNNTEVNIKNLIEKLNIKNDYRVRNLYNLYNTFCVREYSQELFECLELYTYGDYINTIPKLKDYITKYSDDFQSQLLLIKSYINAGSSIDTDVILPIFNDIYNIYTLSSDYNQSLNSLMMYYKLYNGTTWKYKLKGLILRKTGSSFRDKYIYLSYLNDKNITPNYVFKMFTAEKQEKILESLSPFCNKNATVFLYLGDYKRNIDIHNITKDKIKLEIYKSTKYMLQGDFVAAINKLKKLKKSIPEDDYYNIEKISKKLFFAMKKVKDYKSIIYMTVELYFTNKNLIKRFDFSDIRTDIYNIDDINIKLNIRYPIFIYIADKNDVKHQRIAYSNFMDANEFQCANDIIENSTENKELIIFFLHKICTQHLLKRDSRVIMHKQDSEDLRIDILRVLIDLDSANYKIYFNEIKAITTHKNIRHKTKQFNRSRIFVDATNIKKQYKDLLQEEFNKYLTIKDFENTITALDINDESNLMNIVSEIHSRRVYDVNYNQEYIVIKNLVIRIRDELLFNPQYGLDTFLSSRIRHGFCKSSLRSAFEECNLISQKQNDNDKTYNINKHLELLNSSIDNETFVKIQKYLSDFTNAIESTIEEVKSKWIKVKTTSDDIGDFDYSTFISASMFLINNSGFNNYSIFYDNIVELFEQITSNILQNIRNKINKQLKDFFVEKLNKLEKQISEINNPLCSTLINSINKCRIKIDVSLSEFTEIFHLEKVSYKNFTCEDLIETCIEINNKLNKNFNSVKIKKDIKENYLFVGEHFPYFVDLVNQIINNAIEHSNLSMDQLVLDIKTSDKITLDFEDNNSVNLTNMAFQKEKKYIDFKIQNNMSRHLDVELMRNKIESVFEKVHNKEILKKYSQTEGGTGLYKLYTTLQYHIGEKYIIYYSIKEGMFLIGIIIEVDQLIEKENYKEV